MCVCNNLFDSHVAFASVRYNVVGNLSSLDFDLIGCYFELFSDRSIVMQMSLCCVMFSRGSTGITL